MHIKRTQVLSILIFSIVLSGVLSCSSDDDNNNAVDKQKDGRQSQAVNLYDNQIAPLQNAHVAATADLKEKAVDFKNDINQANLTALKAAWKDAFYIWKQDEIYNLGEIQNSFVTSGIDKFPTDPEVIENGIDGSLEIDDRFIPRLSVKGKGYAALEYLVFDEDESATIEQFTTGENAERRQQYLVALAVNLNAKAQELKQAWESYEQSFKNSLDTGVDGNQNQIVNGMVAGIENIKNMKINQALGSVPIDETQLEAFRSETSKAAIAKNLQTVKLTYTGNVNGQNGYGMENYLTEVLDKPALNNTIKESFDEVSAALNLIDAPLKESITSQPGKFENLTQKITELIALFKVDLAKAADIIITFSDNDGDWLKFTTSKSPKPGVKASGFFYQVASKAPRKEEKLYF